LISHSLRDHEIKNQNRKGTRREKNKEEEEESQRKKRGKEEEEGKERRGERINKIIKINKTTNRQQATRGNGRRPGEDERAADHGKAAATKAHPPKNQRTSKPGSR
jgi:hypothetical protein